MNKVNITDIKTFMSKLLIKNDFDDYQLREATITTFNTFTIDGRIKESFYTKEDFDTLEQKNFSSWAAVKPHCFNIIKGKNLPVSFKIVLKLNEAKTTAMINAASAPVSTSEVEGLYLNIKYENNTLDCITATSLFTFTTDKSLENYWDKEAEKFLLALF